MKKRRQNHTSQVVINTPNQHQVGRVKMFFFHVPVSTKIAYCHLTSLVPPHLPPPSMFFLFFFFLFPPSPARSPPNPSKPNLTFDHPETSLAWRMAPTMRRKTIQCNAKHACFLSLPIPPNKNEIHGWLPSKPQPRCIHPHRLFCFLPEVKCSFLPSNFPTLPHISYIVYSTRIEPARAW